MSLEGDILAKSSVSTNKAMEYDVGLQEPQPRT